MNVTFFSHIYARENPSSPSQIRPSAGGFHFWFCFGLFFLEELVFKRFWPIENGEKTKKMPNTMTFKVAEM